VAGSPEQKLDEIYAGVLRSALRPNLSADEQEMFGSSLSNLLATIAVLFSWLPAPGLAALLFSSETEVLDMLCDLHSVIDVPLDSSVPIRPHHASFRDAPMRVFGLTSALYTLASHVRAFAL
jgi:hypothetical protein